MRASIRFKNHLCVVALVGGITVDITPARPGQGLIGGGRGRGPAIWGTGTSFQILLGGDKCPPPSNPISGPIFYRIYF